ncbi:MAG: MBL fold metallo-hydrolase [Clostridia bacterium]|nr:MBL fold metallo-hydrolase [Clostridia bacterium]
MLKLYPLFSGSSGNMYLIESEQAKILIDIGVTYKAAIAAFEHININVDEIDGLFITHEHVDHTRGIGRLIKKHNMPLYTTSKTYESLYDKYFSKLEKTPNFISVEYDNPISIKDILIEPFKVSHDAVMPVAYKISSKGKTITIATDLGYVDENIYSKLKLADLSVIEANYDPNLLMYGPYPFSTKMRIQGELGHLSNIDTSKTILNLAKEGKRNFILGHISNNNNNVEQAIFEVNHTLQQNGFNTNEFCINIATRDFSDEVYLV